MPTGKLRFDSAQCALILNETKPYLMRGGTAIDWDTAFREHPEWQAKLGVKKLPDSAFYAAAARIRRNSQLPPPVPVPAITLTAAKNGGGGGGKPDAIDPAARAERHAFFLQIRQTSITPNGRTRWAQVREKFPAEFERFHMADKRGMSAYQYWMRVHGPTAVQKKQAAPPAPVPESDCTLTGPGLQLQFSSRHLPVILHTIALAMSGKKVL
jgi:hypothetical protein